MVRSRRGWRQVQRSWALELRKLGAGAAAGLVAGGAAELGTGAATGGGVVELDAGTTGPDRDLDPDFPDLGVMDLLFSTDLPASSRHEQREAGRSCSLAHFGRGMMSLSPSVGATSIDAIEGLFSLEVFKFERPLSLALERRAGWGRVLKIRL